jgi:hypothetical protein
MYTPESGGDSLLKRASRLADSYVNLSGHHTHGPPRDEAGVVNVPSSRFLRPFSQRLAGLSRLQVRRIRASMDHAAKHGLLCHLWWHPHNFGTNQEENLQNLNAILKHYQELAIEYGMVSRAMGDFLPQ